MEVGSFSSSNPFVNEVDENDNVSSENGSESPPPCSTFTDMKLASSPKKGRRSIQKRVVSVPIKEVEGSRLKGDSAPPSDSWAWRKYGQKPIKGSPYPRGYYRCSSSKGCPARKQVERSRVDPTMLVITYSCEHNHPWPASRNSSTNTNTNTNTSKQSTAAAAAASTPTSIEATTTSAVKPEPSSTTSHSHSHPDTSSSSTTSSRELHLRESGGTAEEMFALATTDEFAWFGEMETTSSTVLESPIFAERDNPTPASIGPGPGPGPEGGSDVAGGMIFPMREEDESLFADLGELPECSFVFRHQRQQRTVGPQVGIC